MLGIFYFLPSCIVTFFPPQSFNNGGWGATMFKKNKQQQFRSGAYRYVFLENAGYFSLVANRCSHRSYFF